MDGELLHVFLAGQGDHGAFEALVEPRRARLLLLLVAALGDWHEAEDALQEALLRAYGRLRQLRAAEAFDAWLRGLVLNVARDHLRTAVRRRRREGAPAGDMVDLDGLMAIAWETSPGGVVDREGCMEVLAAIAGLPDLQRRAGRLAWVAGLPAREVAAVLGISRGSVNACLYRARQRLGTSLRTDGVWRRGVVSVPSGGVLLSGHRNEVESLMQHWAKTRPDLRVQAAEPHHPEAHVRMEWSLGLPLERLPAPPPPAEALPLDGLADAAGFDLGPFGDRLLRFSHGDRPYWLPYDTRAHAITYNAEILERLGLPLPTADWTWDDFFGYCRRCAAAGVSPHSMWTPNGMDCGIVAEQLGATEGNLEPVRQAVDFVRQWRAMGLAHQEPKDRNALLSFFEGQCAFLVIQHGETVPRVFLRYGLRPFRWGIAPLPRFRRSNPHLAYAFHHLVGVSAAAPDPVEAFAVAQAIFTDGLEPVVDALPAYRTPGVMATWRAQPLPLGKDCLLASEADTGPLVTPPWLGVFPGGGDALWSLSFGETTVEEGIAALREAVAARAAGVPLELRD